MNYFGIFEQIDRSLPEPCKELDLYEGYFAEMYEEILGSYPEELDVYLSNALCCGGPILEIACGTGRLMIELAKKGFEVEGMDMSDGMINQLSARLERCSNKIRGRIRYALADAFSYKPDRKFGMAMIPATTICLLADQREKTIALFESIYDLLLPHGRLVFDYRADQSDRIKACSPLNEKKRVVGDSEDIIQFQEFNNYIPGYSVVNFYARRTHPTHTEHFKTSSTKKIITQDLIYDIVAHTRFDIHSEESIPLGDGLAVNYLVLQKQQ